MHACLYHTTIPSFHNTHGACPPLPLTSLLYHGGVILFSTPATCSHNPIAKPLLYVADDFQGNITLSIYNLTALHDTWRVIAPFCNSVPGLQLLPKNSVLCLSVLAPFWLSLACCVWWWAKLLLSMFGDGATPVFLGCTILRSLGSGTPLSSDLDLPDADWSITFHSHYTHHPLIQCQTSTYTQWTFLLCYEPSICDTLSHNRSTPPNTPFINKPSRNNALTLQGFLNHSLYALVLSPSNHHTQLTPVTIETVPCPPHTCKTPITHQLYP